MDSHQLVEVLEKVVLSQQLTPIEQLILTASWHGKTYSQIGEDSSYGTDYIKEIGAQLWQKLSLKLGQKVTKKNLDLLIKKNQSTWNRLLAEFYTNNQPEKILAAPIPIQNSLSYPLEYPTGPVALDSPFYINRSSIEELAFQEISNSGAFISIKASSKMGKSSLLNRIIAHGVTQNNQTVYLDLQEAEETIFYSLDKFLRWFCANVSYQLNLTPLIDDYWYEEIGAKVSCKIYFESYILASIKTCLVLSLNEINILFKYDKIGEDFLSMLRCWHEQSTQDILWQKLNLVIVYNTETNFFINAHNPAFNIGLSLKLTPFNLEQIQTLALLYGLSWAEGEGGLELLKPLWQMVGGHPYLIRLTLYYLAKNQITLDELLTETCYYDRIYGDFLKSKLHLLQQHPELLTAIQQVIISSESISLDSIIINQLDNLGLVNVDGYMVTPWCDLYRNYFSQQIDYPLNINDSRLQELEAENKKLQLLQHFDQFTQLPQRYYFEQELEQLWHKLAEANYPLSLVLCTVDHFPVFNQTYGRNSGDKCLQEIATVIKKVVADTDNIAARYTGAEFILMFPNLDISKTSELAEKIRFSVQGLAITFMCDQMGGLPDTVVTVSLGVSSTIPSAKIQPLELINTADHALYRAKRFGGNRVIMSPMLDGLRKGAIHKN